MKYECVSVRLDLFRNILYLLWIKISFTVTPISQLRNHPHILPDLHYFHSSLEHTKNMKWLNNLPWIQASLRQTLRTLMKPGSNRDTLNNQHWFMRHANSFHKHFIVIILLALRILLSCKELILNNLLTI